MPRIPNTAHYLVIALEIVQTGEGGGILEPPVRVDLVRTVQDELLRIDVVQEPLEGLALSFNLEVAARFYAP